MISVLLVDDHADVRKSLKYLLETAGDMQVVGTASNGVEAVTLASSNCPDVIVMDISMPVMDGIEATRQILLHCQLTRVMMLSIFDSSEYIQRALDAGAFGYVLKDKLSKDLLPGIRAVATGKHFFSEQIAGNAEKYLDQN
jgi:DNA-binding NarL/FixJ family response regulator